MNEVIIKDLGWNKILLDWKKINKSYTVIGWMGGSGGNPSTNVAARMAVHEIGAKIKVTEKMRNYLRYVLKINLKKTTTQIIIPPRPVNRMTFDKNVNKIPLVVKKELNMIYDKLSTPKKSLTRIGAWYKGELQEMFVKGSFKPLHKKTIENKGSSKPLIDTGEMKNSITHREFI